MKNSFTYQNGNIFLFNHFFGKDIGIVLETAFRTFLVFFRNYLKRFGNTSLQQ